MRNIVVLGAEAQAASSLACAYPDCAITFVSDHDIIDGWDLSNVRIAFAKLTDRAKLTASADHVVPLCPRWLEPERILSLSALFANTERQFPGLMVPVASRPHPTGCSILKGDRWHRPDVPISGTVQQLEDVTDVHGCGLVYQSLCEVSATIMAIGRCGRGIQLGCMRVLDERFFWDNILQAAETIDAPDVVSASLDLLDALGHSGYFTLNWLRTKDGLRLSSLRQIPRAIFGIFRRSGIDLLDDRGGTKVARAGLRLVATPTYVSFKRLSS